MDFNKLKNETESKMKKTLDALKADLKKVRTGRAQVSMLDSVKVDYYGSPTPLNQVASVACPDAKSFLITPWETPMLKEIEASIVRSDLGLAPMNDGKVIRLRLPDLTEERRKDLVKSTKKIVEDAKVGVRMARRDANDALKQALKDKAISEDDNKRWSDDIQKMTDKYTADIDTIAEQKEKDIMTL